MTTQKYYSMESKVFVSYSRKDQEDVKCIIAQIEDSLGIKCWIDLKGIESSAEFRNVVIKAIDDCEIVLFMVSPNSIASKNVEKEIMYAKDLDKRIVLICLADHRPSDWARFEFPRVDYIRATNEDQMQKLIHDMEGWLGIQAVGPVLKELSKLYEDWEKLEHEQSGILQHVIEKENSIGNRNTSFSLRIKSQLKDNAGFESVTTENTQLKEKINSLEKKIQEFDGLLTINNSIKEENVKLKKEIEELKQSLSADKEEKTQVFNLQAFASFGDGTLHEVSGYWIRFYLLEDFYYGYVEGNCLCSLDSVEKIDKEGFLRKNRLTIDIPTIEDINKILTLGQKLPGTSFFWVKYKGEIRDYKSSTKELLGNNKGQSTLIYIVR